MAEDSIIVADGGDFVGSAAYIMRPRGPMRWLDPGKILLTCFFFFCFPNWSPWKCACVLAPSRRVFMSLFLFPTGAFGTLGVGGGFALGAKLCRPESEVKYWFRRLWKCCLIIYSISSGDLWMTCCLVCCSGLDSVRWRLLRIQRCWIWHVHQTQGKILFTVFVCFRR